VGPEILHYNKLPGETRLLVPGLHFEYGGSRSVVLTPERLSPRGLMKTIPRVSDSVGPGQSLRMCISNTFPTRDADAGRCTLRNTGLHC